ncbi:hypothetical protein F5X68DRAFT_2977 [Plectosphaerella plurivora]|uniref:Uncharacterized protein n=1 Tax=Plectosphaerella plurivora TaxID=936078 RepID=A0A9P8VMK2_9PEZI|nr:hypothetical protein F5X68DRAFT_2977 [Plectosphaerella plurivora]
MSSRRTGAQRLDLEKQELSYGQGHRLFGRPFSYLFTRRVSPRRALAGSCSQHRAVCLQAGRQKLPHALDAASRKGRKPTPRAAGRMFGQRGNLWARRPSRLRTFWQGYAAERTRPGAGLQAGMADKKMRRTTTKACQSRGGFCPSPHRDAGPTNHMEKSNVPTVVYDMAIRGPRASGGRRWGCCRCAVRCGKPLAGTSPGVSGNGYQERWFKEDRFSRLIGL